TAVQRQHLPGHEARAVARQVADRPGDVVDIAEPAQRRARDALAVALRRAVAHGTLGRHGRWRDGIDPDVARAKFAGGCAGDSHDARLDAAVDDAVRRRLDAGDRGDVDDGTAALRVHPLHRRLDAPDHAA